MCYNLLFLEPWESNPPARHKISTENLCASSFQKPVRLSPSRSWGLLITAKKVAPLSRAHTHRAIHFTEAQSTNTISARASDAHENNIPRSYTSLVNHNKSRIWKSFSPTETCAAGRYQDAGNVN
jgi:hypothetical protein